MISSRPTSGRPLSGETCQLDDLPVGPNEARLIRKKRPSRDGLSCKMGCEVLKLGAGKGGVILEHLDFLNAAAYCRIRASDCYPNINLAAKVF